MDLERQFQVDRDPLFQFAPALIYASNPNSRDLPMTFLLLMACENGYQLAKHQGNPAADGPRIEVTPTHLDFGTMNEGEHSVSTFDVTSVGTEGTTLHVSGITLDDAVGSFTILTSDLEPVLEVGETATIEVDFSPLKAKNSATITVASDDETQPKVTVDLLGEGAVPELQIDPNPLDFGETYLGCDKSNEITLTNVGSGILTITSLEETGDAFLLLNEPDLPLDLAAGESAKLDAIFIPAEETKYTGALTVESNEPKGVQVAQHSGKGVYAPAITDSWTVPTDPPTDILFFVDQSGSMDDNARALAANFTSFIGAISNYTTDWHVMVVNDDDGCNNSGILTSGTADYQGKFEAAVVKGGGIWTEAGLTVTSKAVDLTDAGECNDHFMRSSALLHIIMVSDEAEQSTKTWDHYVNQIIAKKGDPALVKLSSIAGDYPNGCGTADPGTGYYEASAATGGEFLSICSNWSNNVNVLANASITQDRFTLTQTAAPSTIKVEVNGNRRNSNWTYDSINNVVLFTANLPGEGDVVDITYNPLVHCD